MKGEALMRKRHLEILGYRVVQVKESIMHQRYYSSSFKAVK